MLAKSDLAPVGSNLDLTTKPDPQTFGIENKKENVPNNIFFYKKNNKDNATTTLQYRSQYNESIFIVNIQCFSHAYTHTYIYICTKKIS